LRYERCAATWCGENVRRRQAQRFYPLRGAPGVALCIALRLASIRVMRAVDLDGEPRGVAVEVENVAAERMLPAKWRPSSCLPRMRRQSIASGSDSSRRSVRANSFVRLGPSMRQVY
jgi:hypothetical protein